jgi:hypothetical protein
MVKVTFEHWTTGEHLTVVGHIFRHMNESSEWMVIQKEDGSFEDIIKTTIVSIEEID